MELHLNTFGARLRSQGKLFKMSKTDLEQRLPDITEEYAVHQVQLLLLYPGTSTSTDALNLALEHDVTVVVLDKHGYPKGYLFPTRPSSTMAIWKKQTLLAQSPEGLRFSTDWIMEKIEVRARFLLKLAERRDDDKRQMLEAVAARLLDILEDFRFVHIGDNLKAVAATIRGLEGKAGRLYYKALSQSLAPAYRFEGRSYQPARDAFNAFLNYGYAILYRRCTRALWFSGVNPYIGFMHYDGYQRHSLTFDFVEPYRVWIEQAVYKIFASKIVTKEHADYNTDHQGYWLSHKGIHLLTDTVLNRLSQKKLILEGREFVKDNYLRERARRFCSLLLPGHTAN